MAGKPQSTKELIPTRHSLLSRLKDWNDQESWRDFFETYAKLIYRTAIRAGLTDTEAQDVVQETVIAAAKHLPEFDYDPQKGSFKTWLMRQTKWRIVSQYRRRQRGAHLSIHRSGNDTRTGTIERIADPAGPAVEATWDAEWEEALVGAAMTRVRKQVDPKQFQIFDLYVVKKWSVLRISRALNVNPAAVYLAKHRVSKLIKKEITRLQAKPV
jgi:RNA polymerase sigma-70 factor (ECF subfamily)